MILTDCDLWECVCDARCITTNGDLKRNGHLVMGAGIAKQALDKHPGIDKRLGDLVKMFGNIAFYLQDIGIISMPTKNHWRNGSDLDFIVKSATRIAWLATENDLKIIAMPKPGCGLGRLSWPKVEDALKNILDDRFIICVQ